MSTAPRLTLLALAALLTTTACGDLFASSSAEGNAGEDYMTAGNADPAAGNGATYVGDDAEPAQRPAQGGKPIADPYLRADASFSRFPLEKRTTPQAIGRLTNGADCDDEMILCEWEDDNGVRHIMGGDVLAIKVIEPAPGDTRNISALGIGTARQRGQVLKNVRAFIPEIAIDCRTEEESGEGDGLYSCGGSFDKGAWIKLIFDTNDTLVTARIDAFQIN